MENPEIKLDVLAKFYKRILAYIVDSLVLGLFGAALGFLFTSSFLALGWKGRFIGFIISISYFTIFNSHLANSQTIGQRILKIKVISSNGHPLPLPISLFRSLFLPTIALLNNWTLPINSNSYLIQLIAFIFFSLIVLELYFLIFNKKSKQLLHDVITKTYVVNAQIDILSNDLPSTPRKVYLASLFSPILVLVVMLIVKFITPQPLMTELLSIQEDLQNEHSMQNVSVHNGKTTYTSINEPKTTVSYLRISYVKSNFKTDDSIIADKIISVLKKYNITNEVDIIEFYFITGYDIGISSQWKNTSRRYTKEEFLELIK